MLSHFTDSLAAFLKEHYKDVGLAVAGVWALYNLLQRGSLHPLLDLKVSGRLIRDGKRQYLVSSLEASNVHLPMVRIELSAMRVSRREAGDDSYLVDWAELATVEVFEKQRRIWAGETLRREMLLNVPPDEHVFLIGFRVTRKLSRYRQPFSLLSNAPGLERFAPKRRSWYVESIVEGCKKPEVKDEGNHSSGRRGNGQGNEGLEGSDQENEAKD